VEREPISVPIEAFIPAEDAPDQNQQQPAQA
jgi:hypothetical protein